MLLCLVLCLLSLSCVFKKMYYIELDSAAYNRKSSETQWLKYRRSLFLFLLEMSGSRQLRPGMKALRSQAQNWGSSQLPAHHPASSLPPSPGWGWELGFCVPVLPAAGQVWYGMDWCLDPRRQCLLECSCLWGWNGKSASSTVVINFTC